MVTGALSPFFVAIVTDALILEARVVRASKERQVGSGTGMQPAVSVVMPLHGDGRFLQHALESVCGKWEACVEVVCVDDGLTQSADTIVSEFRTKMQEFRLLRNEGRGIVAALNTGLRAARGEFIARMDGDDVSLPGRFAIQLDYLRRHPGVSTVGTQAILIDAEGRVLRRLHTPVGSERVHAALDVSCAMIHPTVMMRKAAVLAAGGYRVGFDGAEDHELWLRLRRTGKLDNLSVPLLLYRSHTGQVSVRKQLRQARLAALAMVADHLRDLSGIDYLVPIAEGSNWRTVLRSADPLSVEEVRILTALGLAGNGGTVRSSGARYLRGACAQGYHGVPHLHDRLALACVRHQILLARGGRRMDAVAAAARDLLQWRGRLLSAYVRQVSSRWRSGVASADAETV